MIEEVIYRNEEYRRRFSEVKRKLNGGAIDGALGLLLELVIEMREQQEIHLVNNASLYRIARMFKDLKWTIISLSGFAVALAALFTVFMKISESF